MPSGNTLESFILGCMIWFHAISDRLALVENVCSKKYLQLFCKEAVRCCLNVNVDADEFVACKHVLSKITFTVITVAK